MPACVPAPTNLYRRMLGSRWAAYGQCYFQTGNPKSWVRMAFLEELYSDYVINIKHCKRKNT